jgi:hypothetical protein
VSQLCVRTFSSIFFLRAAYSLSMSRTKRKTSQSCTCIYLMPGAQYLLRTVRCCTFFWMRVCVYVCMCVCVCQNVCALLYTFVCMNPHMHAYNFACTLCYGHGTLRFMHEEIWIDAYIFTYYRQYPYVINDVHVYRPRLYMYSRVHSQTDTYAAFWQRTCIHACTHAYT